MIKRNLFNRVASPKITPPNRDANMATNVDSGTMRLMGSPTKKSKNSGVKGSVALLKEFSQLGWASHDSDPRKSIPREVGQLGSNHTVNFSKGTSHHIKSPERKCPTRGVIQKCDRALPNLRRGQ